MALPPEFLDEIRAALPISQIVARHVRLKKLRQDHVGLCPFHQEKTPSFTVSDQKGFYHCFGCGAHGDVIGFTMKMERLPFPEAVERLAAVAGLQMPTSSPEARERERRRASLLDVLEAACRYYEKCLASPEGRRARDYLRERGIDDEIIARFRLGFAPGNGGLRAALTSQTMPRELLEEAGLLRRSQGNDLYEFFRGRVMFPITDRRDRVVAFGARILGDGQPKYLNSPQTPVFDKGRMLYGIAQAQGASRETGRLIVTEGYMDVIALSQAGFSDAVAPLGTALSETQIEALWKICSEPFLCFDGDEAGRRAAARSADVALPILRPGCSLRFVSLPAGEDPDSLIRSGGARAFESLLGQAEPLDAVIWAAETQGQELGTPERLARLEESLENRARKIEDRKVHHQYLALFRRKLRELSGYRQRPADGFRPGLSSSRAGDVGMLRRRQDQVLLATILNHPDLLHDHTEELAEISLQDSRLDKVRMEILNIYASDSDLESGELKNQLISRGYSDSLTLLLGQDVFLHGVFAREDALEQDVKTGFTEILSRCRASGRKVELEEAQREYAQHPTDENWQKISKLRTDIAVVTAETGGSGR